MIRGALRATPLLAACGTLALASLVATPSSAQQPPTLDALLGRATAYVDLFISRFSTLVAEEHYIQDVDYSAQGTVSQGSGFQPPRHREMRSDLFLLKSPASDNWLLFRDVGELNGSAVQDRDQRRAILMQEVSASAADPSGRVLREGARYNLAGGRLTNNPLVALVLLQGRYQARLQFTIRNADRGVGPDVWTVDFQERQRSTILQGIQMRGRFWIERETGRVVRTQISVAGPRPDTVTTSFRFDEALGIAVPVKMEEAYIVLASPNAQGRGTATYAKFRPSEARTADSREVPVVIQK